ncbi:N-acetyltransferase [Acetobacter pasteurianus NBRC 3299]|nr:GCN5 family acetyltransferase [Acetobacter pasteurianus]GCD76263.1 N-acetyltransferase [Acetobacter pasteurianus NBRC 3299]
MTPSADTTWRSMTPDDLAGVMTLTARAHPDYMEDLAVFEERLKLAPDGCFSLVRDKEVLGYLISHPWQGLVSPPLNTLLHALPDKADSWYIHDLALSPTVRGRGFAQQALLLAEHIARKHKLHLLLLTSTRHAIGFWQKAGFTDAPTNKAEQAVLASYDTQARLLYRAIS